MKSDVIAMVLMTLAVLALVLWEGTRPAQCSPEWNSFVEETLAVAKRKSKIKRK